MEAMKVQLEQIPEPLKTALEASAANCQDKGWYPLFLNRSSSNFCS